MEEEGIDRIQSEVMLLAPRRVGKTMSICSYVLGLLLWIPGIKIAVFSTNGRTTKAILSIIMAFIDNLDDENVTRRLCKVTGEELFISETVLPEGCGPSSDAARRQCTAKGTSQLKCYPATVTGTLFFFFFAFIHFQTHACRHSHSFIDRQEGKQAMTARRE